MTLPKSNPNWHGTSKLLALPRFFCPKCKEPVSYWIDEDLEEVNFAPCFCGQKFPPVGVCAFTEEYPAISYQQVDRP